MYSTLRWRVNRDAKPVVRNVTAGQNHTKYSNHHPESGPVMYGSPIRLAVEMPAT